ncbi:MAG: trimeric intracellular cation channel family protein, partial [Chitinophagaceae bacterium]
MSFILSFNDAMDITGTFSFAVAGAMAAMEKKLDPFGVIILAFVTAIGGGTVRDLLLGAVPVSWLLNMRTVSVILAASILSLFFANRLRKFFSLLTVFDALGLGFFTLTGMEKAIDMGLQPGICIALGTITGCFGGVIRDVLLNNIPLIFRKEIYASASIAGGTVYYLLQMQTSK